MPVDGGAGLLVEPGTASRPWPDRIGVRPVSGVYLWPAWSCRIGRRLPLLLAHDLFGDSFVQAGCRLGGEPTSNFLRVFKDVKSMDLACTVPKLDATPTTCRFTLQQAQE